MSAASRARFLLAAGWGLLLLGLAGWWRVSPRALDGATSTPLLAAWLSAVGLVAATAWLLEHPAGRGWSPTVASLTLAVTAPLSMVPLVTPGNAGTAARVGLTVASLAVVPLALDLAGVMTRAVAARRARRLAVACVIVALVVVWAGISWARSAGYLSSSIHDSDGFTMRWLLCSAATLAPAIAAATSVLRDPESELDDAERILVTFALGSAGLLPVISGIALVTDHWPVLVIPVTAALATAAVLGRLVIGPLAREAGSAFAQRDLMLAVSEAERTRLAAALHDGPLGDVALLVQRLDASGDEENAALARAIATDLRSVGSDLHLPIVDDLGVGPALEWLVERLSRRAGVPIDLQVDEAERPPAVVESAVYRIAQEALLNAVKHGDPPVTIRYASRLGSAELEVVDSGPGLDPDARTRAEREGRLGLLMMRRRAEAVGGRLSVATRSVGGTRVALSWRGASA